MDQVTLKKHHLISAVVLALCSFVILGLAISCDNKSNAQDSEIGFTETYSGSFETAPAATDSNDDGKPANIGQFLGTSTFGGVSIQSLNEFEAALVNANCKEGEIEFTLVQGHFVKRFSNGELIFGSWASGVSCFDPVTSIATTTQVGNFTGGTGQFENVTGPIQIDYTSTFLAVPSVDGFDFGGSSGTGFGTIIFNGN